MTTLALLLQGGGPAPHHGAAYSLLVAFIVLVVRPWRLLGRLLGMK